nr:F-box domain, FBD domain, leucine-rich repeat domain, L domain-like protein [Tanacetum cinerariifolium]
IIGFIQNVFLRNVVEVDFGIFVDFHVSDDDCCLRIDNSESLEVLKVRSVNAIKMSASSGYFSSLRTFDVFQVLVTVGGVHFSLLSKVQNDIEDSCSLDNLIDSIFPLFRKHIEPDHLISSYFLEGVIARLYAPSVLQVLRFECPWTKLVWFGSPLGLRVDATHGLIISRVQALLETVHSKSERMKLHTSLANIAWQIWKSRNGKIFNACQLYPRHAISSTNLMVSDFNYVFPTSHRASSTLVCHDVPQESSLRAALGVIARDSTGSILLCSGEKWRASDPLMAKILAIRKLVI